MSKTLKILSRPQGNAEEYGRWAVNPYKGCSHGCLYCYLKKGVWANGLGGNTAELKTGVVNEDHAYHLAMAEIIEHREEIIKDGGLFMTFTSDPCAPETRDLFFHIASESMRHRVPVTLLTKAAGFFCPTMRGFADKYKSLPDDTQRVNYGDSVHAFLKWLSNDAHSPEYMKRHIAFGWTLTGRDELEPHAGPNGVRIAAMREMADYGMKVWASIEPVIDFDSSYKMITDALRAGCKHFKIGLLTNNTRVVRKDFSFGEHHFKAYRRDEAMQFVGYVMEMTQGLATVYWKQSFYDFFGDEPIHGMTAHEFLHQWSHSVDKDWNMFK